MASPDPMSPALRPIRASHGPRPWLGGAGRDLDCNLPIPFPTCLSAKQMYRSPIMTCISPESFQEFTLLSIPHFHGDSKPEREKLPTDTQHQQPRRTSSLDPALWSELIKQTATQQHDTDDSATLTDFEGVAEDVCDTPTLIEGSVGAGQSGLSLGINGDERPVNFGSLPAPVRKFPSNDKVKEPTNVVPPNNAAPRLLVGLEQDLPDLRSFWRKPLRPPYHFVTEYGCISPEQVMDILAKDAGFARLVGRNLGASGT